MLFMIIVFGLAVVQLLQLNQSQLFNNLIKSKLMCCGQKRSNYVSQPENAYKPVSESGPQRTVSDVIFEYTGSTGLTVIGSITRQRYRFSGKGDRLIVDYRDVNGMMGVPMVQKIKNG